jgi:hypothetical protein
MEETQLNELKKCREDIICKIDALPESLRAKLMESFQIEGVSPVNMSDIREMIFSNNTLIFDRMRELLRELGLSVSNGVPMESNQFSGPQTRDEFAYFVWGGKMGRMVPE